MKAPTNVNVTSLAHATATPAVIAHRSTIFRRVIFLPSLTYSMHATSGTCICFVI